MKQVPLILILILILILPSCIENERREITAFYNIDSLIDRQIVELTQSYPLLSKTGSVDGKAGDVRFKPDSVTWERELGMFRTLDINEPRLVELYEISSSQLQDGEMTTYTSNSESTRINWIEIQQNGASITSLRGEISERNPIYGNVRQIGMTFNDNGLVKEYFVSGGEKLSLKDSMVYLMNATVQWD